MALYHLNNYKVMGNVIVLENVEDSSEAFPKENEWSESIFYDCSYDRYRWMYKGLEPIKTCRSFLPLRICKFHLYRRRLVTLIIFTKFLMSMVKLRVFSCSMILKLWLLSNFTRLKTVLRQWLVFTMKPL